MKIKRNIFNKLCSYLFGNESVILIGPRQVGKSYLLKQVEKWVQKKGKRTAFFDLEQPSVLADFNQSDEALIKKLCHAGDVIFIDEFHYIKNASKIFKAIYDSKAPIKIYASGSSALEIHTHLKESLAGRKFIEHIYPCGLDEIAQVQPSNTFDYYSVYGGMPGIAQQKDPDLKKQLLLDILQAYVLKDIKSLIREENLRAFNHLVYLLAQAQGSTISVEGLAREVGMTPNTINTYLDIMAQTYVNFPVNSYSQNLGNELKKSKKYYLYDIGIRNALLKNFSTLEHRSDAGAIAETFVFQELQRQLSPETEIRFWRLKSGEEVDFIWIKNQVAVPIEVKVNWGEQKIPKGLAAFLRRYPKTKEAFVVSRQKGREIKMDQTSVRFISFEEMGQITSLN